MNTQQIEYFLEVVRQGSFTKAAQTLYTSQPSLSRQITKLEEELGTSLFNRSRSGVVLSNMGRKYYDAFVEFQQRLVDLALEAKRNAADQEKSVCIGIPEGWDIQPVVSKLSEQLERDGIKLNMSFAAYNYRSLLAQLKNNQMDGCICPKGLIAPLKQVAFMDLPALKNVILYSKQHRPPENGTGYTIQDFRNEKLLMLKQEEDLTHGTYQMGFLHKEGIVPEIREYHNIDSILLDVSLDRGFAISDVWSRGMSDRSLGHLVLEQEMPICVAWNAHHVCDDLFVFAEALSTCLSCFF